MSGQTDRSTLYASKLDKKCIHKERARQRPLAGKDDRGTGDAMRCHVCPRRIKRDQQPVS